MPLTETPSRVCSAVTITKSGVGKAAFPPEACQAKPSKLKDHNSILAWSQTHESSCHQRLCDTLGTIIMLRFQETRQSWILKSHFFTP